MEKELDKLSVRFDELNKILSDPGFYDKKDFIFTVKEHKMLKEKIDGLTAEWVRCVDGSREPERQKAS